jgi:hypothetical protein
MYNLLLQEYRPSTCFTASNTSTAGTKHPRLINLEEATEGTAIISSRWASKPTYLSWPAKLNRIHFLCIYSAGAAIVGKSILSRVPE